MNEKNSSNPVLLPPEMAEQFRNAQWGAKQLAAIPLFKELTHDELAEIYGRGEIISFKPKSYAVIEGEPTRGLFIILHGTVSVYKNDPVTGAMHRLAFLESGANFGELSLFDTAPRSATVAAESVCHMFSLDAEVFNKYLEERGEGAKYRFYKACAEDLVGRFRGLNSDYITAQQLLWKHALSPKTDTDEAKDEDGHNNAA